VDPQAGVVSTMSHHLLMVAPQHKAKVAAQIAGRHAGQDTGKARSIFFVRTQMAVDRVTEQLRERGLPAAGLHGGMTQVARTKTLEDFKEGRTPVLVATDVAARGIHVDGIDLVVHLDPPRDSKDYLHRAGRTARAGQAGVVASLVLPKQRKQAQRLMDQAGVTAEELDTAPLGVGGKLAAAGSALAELTGAREVPEPGDVPVFTLPVRERSARPRDGWDRDRGGRYDRAGGEYRSGSFERRGRDFERRDGGGWRGGESRGGDRYGRDRFGRGEREEGRGAVGVRPEARRDGEQRGNPSTDGRQGARFDRERDGERFGRGPRREGGFDPQRGAEGSKPGFAGGGERGGRFEQRGGDNRGGHGAGAGGWRERGGFDRNHGADRFGRPDRFERDARRTSGPSQRPDRDRTDPRHTS
jgi:superfamily II DNA/RNA helicase